MGEVIWTQSSVEHLLQTNDRAVGRALIVLLNRQTEVEQQSETTVVRNHRGFTQADARKMTSMAQQFVRTEYLSPRQLKWLRASTRRHKSHIGKYHRQLLEAIEEAKNVH
jgi:hypothetical protein